MTQAEWKAFSARWHKVSLREFCDWVAGKEVLGPLAEGIWPVEGNTDPAGLTLGDGSLVAATSAWHEEFDVSYSEPPEFWIWTPPGPTND